MVELTKNKKSSTWILTKTDNEGFHRQVNLTREELDALVVLWSNTCKDDVHITYHSKHQ